MRLYIFVRACVLVWAQDSGLAYIYICERVCLNVCLCVSR